MKRFLYKTSLMLLLIPIVGIGFYYAFDLVVNSKSSEHSIFIWGDSQAYQNIDLKVLQEITGKSVYTSAQHGAGAYDLLVFTDKVPKNSTVIVSLSEPMMIRPKSIDSDRSGFSMSGLKILRDNNYTVDELMNIFKRTAFRPKVFFEGKTNMLPFSDGFNYPEKIQILLKNLYSEIPASLEDKQKIFLTALKKLEEKNCNITIVEFPLHPVRQILSNKSPFKTSLENFKLRLLQHINQANMDTIQVDHTKELMHDTSHFNDVGAKECTYKLGESIKNQEQTMLYQVHWR